MIIVKIRRRNIEVFLGSNHKLIYDIPNGAPGNHSIVNSKITKIKLCSNSLIILDQLFFLYMLNLVTNELSIIRTDITDFIIYKKLILCIKNNTLNCFDINTRNFIKLSSVFVNNSTLKFNYKEESLTILLKNGRLTMTN